MMPVPEKDVWKIGLFLESLNIPFSTLFDSLFSGYYIQARLGGYDAPLRTFVTIGELYRSTGLFSRATAVWQVVSLPLPENRDEIPQVYALKDTWRARHRNPEVNNYNRIFAHHRTDNVHGLARCLGSVDLGEMDDLQGHCTNSARLRIGTTNGDILDCNHMRDVLFPLGKPLDQFQSTRLLVEGIRDAMKGMLYYQCTLVFSTCS
jgi:hypothetical protein